MIPEEKAELEARRAASAATTNGGKHQHLVTSGALLIEAKERELQRRLIAATLPGGLEEYWRLVEQEIRR